MSAWPRRDTWLQPNYPFIFCNFTAMYLFKHLTLLGLSVLIAGIATTALAQNRYNCRQPNGLYMLSDRPCPGTNTPIDAPSYTAPSQAARYSANGSGRANDIPEYLPYMTPRCSALNDAIRTSNARGVGYRAVDELRRNYQQECAENESEARNRVYQDRNAANKARNEARITEIEAQQQSQAAQQQCDESRRIISSKKRRTDLSDAERAELQRFEVNIRARCG